MGYYISGDGDIAFAKDKQGDALAALQQKRYEPAPWSRSTTGDTGPGSWSPGWLSKTVGEFDSLYDLLDDYGFDVDLDGDGTLKVLSFDNKASDEEELFEPLAPFVTAGGEFTWQGEEGEHWRWVFDGTGFKTQYGHVVFVSDDES